MDETKRMTERFAEDCPHPRSIAYQILGSVTEADAVQDTWSAAGTVPSSHLLAGPSDTTGTRGWMVGLAVYRSQMGEVQWSHCLSESQETRVPSEE